MSASPITETLANPPRPSEIKPAPWTRFIKRHVEGVDLGLELRDFILQIVDPAFVGFDRHLDPAVPQCAR